MVCYSNMNQNTEYVIHMLVRNCYEHIHIHASKKIILVTSFVLFDFSVQRLKEYMLVRNCYEHIHIHASKKIILVTSFFYLTLVYND